MGDEPRQPLVFPGEKERVRRLALMGLGPDMYPLNRTPAEAEAYRRADAKETPMEAKPGYKTTEFWMKLAAGAAIAFLTWTMTDGLAAIGDAFKDAGVVGAIVALVVPLAKAALGWALHKLTETYADNRTEAKAPASSATG